MVCLGRGLHRWLHRGIEARGRFGEERIARDALSSPLPRITGDRRAEIAEQGGWHRDASEVCSRYQRGSFAIPTGWHHAEREVALHNRRGGITRRARSLHVDGEVASRDDRDGIGRPVGCRGESIRWPRRTSRLASRIDRGGSAWPPDRRGRKSSVAWHDRWAHLDAPVGWSCE
jgi:hypothetical protein